MASKSSIEWLSGGATWNPIRADLAGPPRGRTGWFCTKPSPGCKNCYAEQMNRWRGNGLEYTVPNLSKVRLFLDEKILLQPLHWKKGRLIFPCSMTDWMADFVPDEWRDKMLAVMALTPQHTYLTLTKRAGRQRDYFGPSAELGGVTRDVLVEGEAQKMYAGRTGEDPSMWLAVNFPLKNHWPGVSVEDQPRADERIPHLLQTPAVVRWVSAEPLLGPIERKIYAAAHTQPGIQTTGILSDIDWLVVGGESGPSARPMHPDWARSLRDQCQAAGVPFFFKQWGEWAYSPGQLTGGSCMVKVGKKAAGRLLDGREWNEYPEVRP